MDLVSGHGLVKTDKLKKYFEIGPRQFLHAVDGVSLEIAENESFV